MTQSKGIKLGLLFLILGLAVIAGLLSLSILPDYLWFSSHHTQDIWLISFKSKWLHFGVGFLVTFIWLTINKHLAFSISKKTSFSTSSLRFSNPLLTRLASILINPNTTTLFRQIHSVGLTLLSVVISGIFGLIIKSYWLDTQLAFKASHSISNNITDPLFNLNIGFFLLQYPIIKTGITLGLTLCTITLIMMGWIYFSHNVLAAILTTQSTSQRIKTHVFSIAAIWFWLIGLSTWVSRYSLNYSSQTNLFFGAGYTESTISLLMLKITSIIWIAVGCIWLLSGFRKGIKLPFLSLITLLAVSFVLNKVLPGFIQNYIVTPNEFTKQKPYLERNIHYTQVAYGLDSIQTREFEPKVDLSAHDIQANPLVLNNIRLWNSSTIQKTFSQLQEIRLYYEFVNVDLDRYLINGNLQQVVVSPRELDSSELSQQAQTWINRHLVYTHGYGILMSPVNQVTQEGLPEYFIKDLPPKSTLDIPLTRPEIYYGEKTTGFIITNTKQAEFDYPKGDSNVYTQYSGTSGIRLDSWLKRLLYAIKFSDIKLLISPQIQSNSQLLYDRTITTIAKKITPFLHLDKDPYIILTDEGRLVWMIDAYTLSSKFPYSEPYNTQLNYIRNSVKITIDAYDGSIHYYIADSTDPIINAYTQVFPTLFKPLSDMPQDIRSHVRYPTDLFLVQSHMFKTYHMTDPQVFYNKEDVWNTPKEIVDDQEMVVYPYYSVTKLPGDTHEDYVLMLPFTPTNKNNMIGLFSAKCSPENYGELVVYKFPKEKTIYGPLQIESRIDQDTDISQKLTLWGQVGSRVIRGKLMVIPVKNSLIYVEPIYLQATQSKLPELKRVIVGYGDKIVMATSIQDALNELFPTSFQTGSNSYLNPNMTPNTFVTNGLVDPSILTQVIQEFEAYKRQAALSNWENMGTHLSRLDALIQDLKKRPAQSKQSTH